MRRYASRVRAAADRVALAFQRMIEKPQTGARPALAKPERGPLIIGSLALLCFLIWTATSCARWASFAYRTFDLAYYVQALWQLIHGRLPVSVENVPLLGNHVEPIVFLIAPIFFVIRHPMLFVVLQNAALATMGPVAYRIGRRLRLEPQHALLLSGALLLAPATGCIALHEFHPEAFAAPFLLLMLQAWVSGSRARHWLWFCATLACKENMALLLVGYCVVQCFAERRRCFAELRGWFLWPMLAAVGWFFVCTMVITPAFNSGNIDYGALYDRLGNSAGEILANAITKPHLVFEALGKSLREGNLVWGLLFPFLCLPLFRPRWLLITGPILLQHLLSWRSSEWTLYFHYAAPLLPFFWLAAATALTSGEGWELPKVVRRFGPGFVLAACIGGQIILGPAGGIAATARDWLAGGAERGRKSAFIAAIPANASVVAPLPYLSHLAMREELYSLHYVLKGLKTLSRAPFEPPPPTDFVLIDYADSATFDASAGFYHPAMKAVDGRVFRSSDQLLHDFLKKASWQSQSVDELTLLRRAEEAPPTAADPGGVLLEFDTRTRLISIEKSREVISLGESFKIRMLWRFEDGREIFPWLQVQLVMTGGPPVDFTRGLCAPEARPGEYEERWEISATPALPEGDYRVEAIFSDHPKWAWAEAMQQPDPTQHAPAIPLGNLRVLPVNQKTNAD